MSPTVTSFPQFVHLRLHSEYSISDGMVRLGPLAERAAIDRQGALALTDLSNLFGLVKFYNEARAHGIKPIAGCDIWISGESEHAQDFRSDFRTDPRQHDSAHRLLLLVRNRAGYLRLCELLSRAWLENQSRGRPELRIEWLQEHGTAGLIALSGGQAGNIGAALASDKRELAVRHAQKWAALFPDAFYIELQRYGQPGAETYIHHATSLAAELGLPVVATHPVQFLDAGEFRAHEARVCIASGEILPNPRRTRRFTAEQYFKTQAEMAALFSDIPSAVENSVEIAKRCNLRLDLGNPRLPQFPTPAGVSLEDYLVRQASEGLELRLSQLYPNTAERDRQRGTYFERLSFETGTIVKMGFAGYFLIVADFINWAKNNGVPVGPGRGSGAGSLVAYSLGITDLDPLAYHLLFERFLNPERVSMPDFDIDFCQEGRDRVIDYVKQKYGADSVAQIATFGTMAAKAAVRDIGRVLDLPFSFVDGIAKLIPFKPGRLVTLADARREEPLLAEREKNEDEVRELLALAERVEGLTRNVGMHAGGVLIAPGKLTGFSPLYAQQGSSNVISQYDKDDVEAVGLVKFDFLGLTTLTILDWASRHIRALYDDRKDFALERVPLDDAAAYEVFKRADTVAVFQFESRGMQSMLKDAKPDRFGDIIALVALYRPGPMDLIPDFIARKQGERFHYPDERVKPILEETYGIMVYQEQVMQMAQIIGGYSLGSADLLRRAMGKKKADEMAKHRAIFAEGARQSGMSAARASEVFDLMEKFAGYGFNKSHAAAYALLAYQTAWLKAHYPAEFMAANLSAALDDTDKVKVLIEDSRRIGLAVLPPDVNASDYRFTPVRTPDQEAAAPRARSIRYGLGAIKGTGQSAIERIVEARRDAPFTGLFDFCGRVDKRLVNRRVVEGLVRAGAFDRLDDDRASLLASVGRAIEAAEQAESHVNQVGLFETGSSEAEAGSKPAVVRVPRWSERQKLKEEKTALGFYLSGHLFDENAAEVRRFARTPLAQIQPAREAQTIAGIIAAVRTQMTRRGKMLIATLDDGSGQIEVSVFNELFDANRQRLREDEMIVVQGVVRNDEFSGGMRVSAERIFDLALARAQHARVLQLSMNGESDASRLMQLLAPYQIEKQPGRAGKPAEAPSGCQVTIRYQLVHDKGAAMREGKPEGKTEGKREAKRGAQHEGPYEAGAALQCEISLGPDWRVLPDDRLIGSLKEWLTPANVELRYV